MAAHHLVRRGLRDILQREKAFLLRQLRMEDHLQQKVAELFLEILRPARLPQDIDPAEHFRRLLDAGRLQAAPHPKDIPPAP